VAGDINITIGAEDQATKILKQVERSTQELTKSVDRMGQVSENTAKVFSVGFKSIAGVAAGVGAAIVAIKGVTAAIAGMSASVDAFNVQEEAARGMTQAQLDFAAALQVSTNVGDEATLALMRQAEMMGVAKDQTDEVATVTTGLAEALGISQTEALKKVTQTLAGNTTALQESIPALRGVTDQAEALAIISGVAGDGLAKLQGDAQSTRGVMERSAGAFGDLSEKIGALFEPIYRVTHQGLAIFAETLQTALGPAITSVNGAFDSMRPYIEAAMEGFRSTAIVVGVAVEAIVSVMGGMVAAVFGTAGSTASGAEMISSAIDGAARFIIGAITIVEVALTNLPTVWDMAVTGIALHLETMRADIEHVFMVVLPEYIGWFGDNALNLLTDYFNLYTTILTNFGKKLIGFWSTIFDFITSGFDGGIEGLTRSLGEAMAGGLTEGFTAATQPLPEIAGRQLTGAEEALASDLARMGTDLGTQFNDKFQSRIEALNAEVGSSIKIEVPDLNDLAQQEVKGKMEVSIPQLQANDERLLTRGVVDDPNKQTAENTKALVEATKTLGKDIATELAGLLNGDPDSVSFVEVV
jgi:hypothetical protein